jgi:hypothetical protein
MSLLVGKGYLVDGSPREPGTLAQVHMEINSPQIISAPSEDAIRTYAYHLYEQGGCLPHHDLDNWLEATACLKFRIPAESSCTRLFQFVNAD